MGGRVRKKTWYAWIESHRDISKIKREEEKDSNY
jgi:hypothetical protein